MLKVSEMVFDGQIGDIMVNSDGQLGIVTNIGEIYVETEYPGIRTLTPKRCYKVWHRKAVFDKQMNIYDYLEE